MLQEKTILSNCTLVPYWQFREIPLVLVPPPLYHQLSYSCIPLHLKSNEKSMPTHHKRTSLVAQSVKSLPATQETRVQFLGWEDPLEKGQVPTPVFLGFPGGSDGKESACNQGDLDFIPGLGRPLEEGMTTHSSILAWRIPMDRGAWGQQSMGSQGVRQD